MDLEILHKKTTSTYRPFPVFRCEEPVVGFRDVEYLVIKDHSVWQTHRRLLKMPSANIECLEVPDSA